MLELLGSVNSSQDDLLVDLTQKTLFLLTLAMGGRISEMHSLHRSVAFVSFKLDGSVFLTPDPSFLAKNEDPSARRPPIRVIPLSLSDGFPYPLCPVNSLKLYLEKTVLFKEGPLFLNPKSIKAASMPCIRYLFRDLIIKADPSAKAKFHDVRKWATSLAFCSGMLTSDLCNAIGWSSVRVFIKHYLSELKLLPFACTAAGSRAEPDPGE